MIPHRVKYTTVMSRNNAQIERQLIICTMNEHNTVIVIGQSSGFWAGTLTTVSAQSCLTNSLTLYLTGANCSVAYNYESSGLGGGVGGGGEKLFVFVDFGENIIF